MRVEDISPAGYNIVLEQSDIARLALVGRITEFKDGGTPFVVSVEKPEVPMDTAESVQSDRTR